MTTRIAKTVLLLLPVLFICQAVPEAGADYYKYKDATGAVCITNKLESVPPKYRASMKVVREEALARKDPAGQKRTEPAPPPANEPSVQQSGKDAVAAKDAVATGRFGQLSAKYPWLKPLAIMGGIFVGFVIVTKLATLIPSPQLARLLYLAFFFGVFLYGYKAYADHLVGSYFTIKQKVLAMFTKANERERLPPENTPANGAGEPPANR